MMCSIVASSISFQAPARSCVQRALTAFAAENLSEPSWLELLAPKKLPSSSRSYRERRVEQPFRNTQPLHN